MTDPFAFEPAETRRPSPRQQRQDHSGCLPALLGATSIGCLVIATGATLLYASAKSHIPEGTAYLISVGRASNPPIVNLFLGIMLAAMLVGAASAIAGLIVGIRRRHIACIVLSSASFLLSFPLICGGLMAGR